MGKASLIAVPVTIAAFFVSGLLSEICCCASPLVAVFLGLAAGALCAHFDKPKHSDNAAVRGAAAGAIAGLAALPAHIIGEIILSLIFAGGGDVQIAPFLLPAARATVGIENWIVNVLFSSCLYELIATVVLAGFGAAGGVLWFRRTALKKPGKVYSTAAPEPAAPEPASAAAPNSIGRAVLSGAILAAISFVFILLIATNWGCLSLPAAVLLGSAAGALAGILGRPRTASRAAVFGGIAGLIASFGAVSGELVGIVIRTFFITTPQGINSMTQGMYDFMGMANTEGARTPTQILLDNIPIQCCCNTLYLLIFVALGALCAALWFRVRGKRPDPNRPSAPAAENHPA